MEFAQILIVAASFQLTLGYCPDSCYCDEMSSICYLETCQDEIASLYTNEIQIYGHLCRNHRDLLKDDVYKETVIVLYDDYCMDLNYCL